MADIIMPSLGADMEDGRLAEWLIKPGDRIRRGDIIAVVETQKGAIEIEAFETGTVAGLDAEIGATVPVGAVIARLAATAAAAPLPEPAAPAAAPPPEPAAAEAPCIPAGEPPAPAPKPVPPPAVAVRTARRVSPAGRKLAAQLGVDVATVDGSGPAGAITSSDVRRASERARPGPARGKPAAPKPRGLDLGEMRKAIAAAMAKAKREIPHYYLSTGVDLKAASDWLAATNAGRAPEDRLLMACLLVKATALALKKHPTFNGFYENGAFRPGPGIHVGNAVAIRGGGLIAPAIHDCDGLTLEALMAAIRDLVARVRKGGLRSSEMTDPTITVSSLGDRGVEALFGVLYPPQVALVGFGKVGDRVLPIDGRPTVRPAVTLCLAADHRVSDGHSGGLFLRRIAELLQEPAKL